MDPMTIAALASLAATVGGQFMNAGAKGDEQSLQRQALANQQKNARKQFQLATSTKTDPYGNKLIYTPGVGWHYDLTEMTQGLLASEQGENLKNLTEDAKRNRDFRARMDAMGREGEQEFENVLNEYRYGERPDEDQSIADLTREIMLARDRGSRETVQNVGRQAIRGLGNPNVLSTIMRQNQEGLGSSLEEAVLRGRRLGKEEYKSDLNSWNQDIGGRMGRFSSLAKGVPQAGIGSSGVSLQQPDISSIMSALQNASSGSNSIMQQMASSAGTPGFNLGALSNPLLMVGKAMSQPDPTNAADPNSWLMSITPDQRWAMQNDVYGNPYSWNIPDVTEEEDPTKNLIFSN